jgi:hypothetical protein
MSRTSILALAFAATFIQYGLLTVGARAADARTEMQSICAAAIAHPTLSGNNLCRQKVAALGFSMPGLKDPVMDTPPAVTWTCQDLIAAASMMDLAKAKANFIYDNIGEGYTIADFETAQRAEVAEQNIWLDISHHVKCR